MKSIILLLAALMAPPQAPPIDDRLADLENEVRSNKAATEAAINNLQFQIDQLKSVAKSTSSEQQPKADDYYCGCDSLNQIDGKDCRCTEAGCYCYFHRNASKDKPTASATPRTETRYRTVCENGVCYRVPYEVTVSEPVTTEIISESMPVTTYYSEPMYAEPARYQAKYGLFGRFRGYRQVTTGSNCANGY